MTANLMGAEFGICHGGPLGSRAKRVTSIGHEKSATADFYTRYQPTANGKKSWISWQCLAQKFIVLDHAEHEINAWRGGISTVDGGRKHARIVLLAGAGERSSLEELSTSAEFRLRSHSDYGKHFQLPYWTVLTASQVNARSMVPPRPRSHLDTVRCSSS